MLEVYTSSVVRLLGIDVGTSGAKAVLIDDSGSVLAEHTELYPLSTPQPGWAEQDPEDWWAAVKKCLSAVGSGVDAIGVTGQMHGSVFLDRSGRVIRPALLWCDQRTVAESNEIDKRIGFDRVREITCNPPLTGFQAPKVLWLKNNEPECYARLSKLLLPKDFIVNRLTATFSTDLSDASGTCLLDVRNRCWSSEILAGLSLKESWLPHLHESSEIVGRTESGVPVVAGAGDQAAGAVGVGAVVPGRVSLSLGTSGVVFTSLQNPKPDATGSTHVFCHANRAWHAMGVMLACGGAVRWARDVWFEGMSFEDVTKLASRAPVGSSGASFLPTLSGERCPFVDPCATGALAGLTLAHGKEHVARAVFEGVTFGLLGCLEAVTSHAVGPQSMRVTGGGAASEFWLQMIADVTGTTCVTMESDNGPAFGAALLAGVGIGVWKDVEVAGDKTLKEAQSFVPSGVEYENAIAKYKRLYPALKDWT